VQDTPRQDVLPRLELGCLASQDTPGRGKLFPQPWLLGPDGQRTRMDTHLGSGWRLVLATDAPELPADAAGISPQLLTTLHLASTPEAEGVVQAWCTQHGCRAALLRPDHYVFGTASDTAQLQSLLREAATWWA
jgi:3-(3-hydroxy-phenyl)propionate hydroxylase